ncbi:MAG TPA: redoxin domain-containing protein [Tepidisphaeraceae bacterium]|jgi:peroxiredoxin
MYPHERSLVKRMEGTPFVLLGINSDPKEHIKKRAPEEMITWPYFWDGGDTKGPIATRWNVHSWPTTYVIDAKGVIRHKDVREESMDKAVDGLMKEMGVSVPPATKPADAKEE